MITDYPKLTKHPLIFVLAEFRFTEVADIESYYPKIQEDLRVIYPLVREGFTQEFIASPNGLEMKASKQWAFSDIKHLNGIIFDHNRLIVVTSDYQRFDNFKDDCQRALKTLIQIVKPAFLTRLGLRYADLILATDGIDIKTFVHNSVFLNSHLGEDIGKLKRQVHETLIETNEGTLLARSIYGETNISTWDDVSSLPVQIKSAQQESERILLDFDHVWLSHLENPQLENNIPIQFSETAILEKLANMHVISRQAFWNSITKKGEEYWL